MYTVVKDNANNYSINSKMVIRQAIQKYFLWLPPSITLRVRNLGPEWEGEPFVRYNIHIKNNHSIATYTAGGDLVLEELHCPLPPLDHQGPQFPPPFSIQHGRFPWSEVTLSEFLPVPPSGILTLLGLANLLILSSQPAVEANILRSQGAPIAMHASQVGSFQCGHNVVLPNSP